MKTISALLIPVILLSIEGFAQNPRVHLAERTTATRCGSCPCFDSIITTCILPGSKTPSVAILYHTYLSPPVLYNPDLDPLGDSLVTDHSEIRMDRNGIYYNSFDLYRLDSICDSAVAQMNRDTVGDVRITLKSKSFNWGTRQLIFTAEFSPYAGDLDGDFYFNAVITEDKILYDQAHDKPCGGKESTYPVMHDNVAHLMAFYPLSKLLISGNWQQTHTLTWTDTLLISSSWIPVNCNLIIYVYKKGPWFRGSKIQQVVKQSVTWPLSVTEPQFPSGVHIVLVPNPARDRLNAHLSLPESGVGDILLMDVTGRPVKQLSRIRMPQGNCNLEINISDLSPGRYIFRLQFNQKSYQENLLINR